ncbi:MAG: T9SS type A sorting domain-containing protein [candidate division WOR-3 bacterium]
MSWGTDHESGRGVIQTQDNGYILVGASWNFPSFGNESPTISKFDNLGNLLWSRQIASSTTGSYTAATSIVEVNSNNLFVAGYTQKFSSGGGRDCFLSKFTSTGTHLWTKSWGGANRDEIYSFSLVITPDNNLVMAGYTQSYGTGGDIILSKFDTTGNHLWSRTVGGTNLDYAWSLALASDSGFAITGLTKSFGVDSVDVILIKTDSLGMTCIGNTVNPVVGSPTPPIGTSTPTITHPIPTIQNQNPQVLAIVPDVQIICYSDIFPPVPFDLLFPLDSTILTIPRPTFIWEASFDSMSGLEKYEVYINDTLKHTGMDTTWTTDYDLSEGYNNWYIVAFDSAGNAQQSNQTWTVYIDYSGPYIDSTTIWHDTSYTGPFPVYTKVTDISGVDTVIIYFRRREDPAWFMIPMIAGTGNWYYGEIPSVFLPNDTVKYYIYAKDLLGNESTDPANAPGTYYWFVANLTGIQDIKVIPQSFSFDLENNPARDKVVFKLALPKDAVVSLRIYDVLGRLVDSPIAGLNRAGSYEIPWGAKNITGVYFYILEALEYKKTGKLIICR